MKDNNITYVTATVDHYDQIAKLSNAIESETGYLGGLDNSRQVSSMVNHSLSKDGVVYVALSGNAVVGFIFTYRDRDSRGRGDCLYISQLGVSTAYSGLGIASTLVEMCKIFAKSNGYRSITLMVDTSNSKAITFYQHNGFVDFPLAYQAMKLSLESYSEVIAGKRHVKLVYLV